MNVSKPLRVGFIGYGYWGPIVLRNFQENGEAEVVAVCDRHQANLEKVRAAGSDIRTTMKAEDVIGAEDVELVVITTQAATHYGLVQAALESGKHVFVEKPFTLDLAEARELGELADKKKRVLMVDHTFMFTPAFERVKQVVAAGELGEFNYFYSLRAGFGVVPKDANVLWHLLYHDVYMILDLAGRMPRTVRAVVQSKVVDNVGDAGNLILTFDGGLTAFIHGSLVFPSKRRDIVVGGADKMLCWDDTQPEERKLSLVSRSAQWDEETQRVAHQDAGTKFIPVAKEEALAKEIAYLLNCVRTGQGPSNGASAAIDVIRVLAAGEASLSRGGAEASL